MKMLYELWPEIPRVLETHGAAVLYWDAVILGALLTVHFSWDMEDVSKVKSAGEMTLILARIFCVMTTTAVII